MKLREMIKAIYTFMQRNNKFVKNWHDEETWVRMLISKESKHDLSLCSKLVKE